MFHYMRFPGKKNGVSYFQLFATNCSLSLDSRHHGFPDRDHHDSCSRLPDHLFLLEFQYLLHCIIFLVAFPGQELNFLYLVPLRLRTVLETQQLINKCQLAIKEAKPETEAEMAYFLQRVKRLLISKTGEGVRKAALIAMYPSTLSA